MTIRGMAVDNRTVAVFMKRLEDSGQFSGVDLLLVSKSAQAKALKLKEFDIICWKPGTQTEGQ